VLTTWHRGVVAWRGGAAADRARKKAVCKRVRGREINPFRVSVFLKNKKLGLGWQTPLYFVHPVFNICTPLFISAHPIFNICTSPVCRFELFCVFGFYLLTAPQFSLFTPPLHFSSIFSFYSSHPHCLCLHPSCLY